MNFLSFKIIPKSPQSLYDNVFEIVIDDIETNYDFDIAGLEYSLKKDGVLQIFMCKCGCMGCGGYYIQVERYKEKILWLNAFENYYDFDKPETNKKKKTLKIYNDTSIKLPLEFSRTNYEDVLNKMKTEMENHPDQKKVYLHLKKSYTNGDFFHG